MIEIAEPPSSTGVSSTPPEGTAADVPARRDDGGIFTDASGDASNGAGVTRSNEPGGFWGVSLRREHQCHF